MRLAARSTSRAPVTTRRTRRTFAQRSASAGSRHAAGVSRKVWRWTEPVSEGFRASHASSAVKARIGASQTGTRAKAASMTASAPRRTALDAGSQ